MVALVKCSDHGDLFTNGGYPIIDESSRGCLRGIIHSIDRLLRLANAETIVVPGHGPIGNRNALLDFRDMLRKVEERIGPMIAAQWAVAEVLSVAPTADFDPVRGRTNMSRKMNRRHFFKAIPNWCSAGTAKLIQMDPNV